MTVGDLLIYLLPRLASSRTRIPSWPPDAFGLMSSLIQRSGAYLQALENWPPPRWTKGKTYADWVSRHGKAWRKAALYGKPTPSPVTTIWKELCKSSFDVPLSRFSRDRDASHCALLLMALADEASQNMGTTVPSDTKEGGEYDSFELWIQSSSESQGLQFQKEVHPSRICVLPKRRTPQSGLNVRSLSHHLCAIEGLEASPVWRVENTVREEATRLNLLLFPWPFHLSPTAFSAVQRQEANMRNMPDDFGFFTYGPPPNDRLESLFDEAIELAIAEVGQLHGVILPEAALSEQDWNLLRRKAQQKEFFLLAGVGSPATAGQLHGTNEVRYSSSFGNKTAQKKHHRWQLDRSQVINYQLGSSLDPNRKWWEYISLNDREVMIQQLNSWLSLMPLICEDLARPDPVGEIVRSIGPDLVIALLMDGPQLQTRWTARNAISLADDPGCSVLTLTSLGMIALSNTRQLKPRIVPALYKDPLGGAQEIEFPPGVQAAVITLTPTPRPEWTADGRPDEVSKTCPTLSGVRFLKLAEPGTKA